MSAHIALTSHRFDVTPILAELNSHEHLWNQYRGRLNHPKSPHRETDDIWLRFARENLDDFEHKTDGPHESVWYPAANELPQTRALAEKMFSLTGAQNLGGIILIRVPPYKRIFPHRDLAWHAAVHQKFAVQIHGNRNQSFDFMDGGISALPGESYHLDNSHPHWVLNPTDEPWINMTVCYRS